MNTTAFTFPFSVKISFGPQPHPIVIPSSSASSTSSAAAGMISRDSKQYWDTFADPERSAILDTSIATFPPPITTVSPESACASSLMFAFLKNSTPVTTPSASSPGTPVLRPPCAPIAT